MAVEVTIYVPVSDGGAATAFPLSGGSAHDVISEQLPTLTVEMEQEFAEFVCGDVQLVARNDDGWWDSCCFVPGAGGSGFSQNTSPFARYPTCHYVEVRRDGVLRFKGDVDLRTVSFDLKARTVAFTALGPLARLKAFNAEECRRPIPNFFDFGKWTGAGGGWIEDTGKTWVLADVLDCCVVDSAGHVFTVTGIANAGHRLLLSTADDGVTTTPASDPSQAYYVRPMVLSSRWDSHDPAFGPTNSGVTSGVGYIRDGHKTWDASGANSPVGLFVTDSVGNVFGPITSVSDSQHRINWNTGTGLLWGALQNAQDVAPVMTMGTWYSIRKSPYLNLLESRGPSIATLGLLGAGVDYPFTYEDDFGAYALGAVVPASMASWSFADPSEWAVVDGQPRYAEQVKAADGFALATFRGGEYDAADCHVCARLRIASGKAVGVFAQKSGTTGLMAYLDANGGAVRLATFDLGASSETVLASDATFAPSVGTWYRLRLLVQGSFAFVKAWEEGRPEPGSWNVAQALASPYPRTGTIGLLTHYAGTHDCADVRALSANGVATPGDSLALTAANGPTAFKDTLPGLHGWAASTQSAEVQFCGPLKDADNGPLVRKPGDTTGGLNNDGWYPLGDHQLWLTAPIEQDLTAGDGAACSTPYYRLKTPAELATLLFETAGASVPESTVVIQPYGANAVRYADFGKKSIGDALTELALVANATVFTRCDDDVRYYFARRDPDVNEADVIDLSGFMADGVTPKIVSWTRGLLWEHWFSSVSVKGSDKQEVIKGSIRPGGQQLSKSSDFFDTYDWEGQVADRLWAYLGKLRLPAKVTAKAAAFTSPPDVFKAVKLDSTSTRWWIIGVREPLREGPEGQRENIELDLICATGIDFEQPDEATSDLSATPLPPTVTAIAYEPVADDPRQVDTYCKAWTVTLAWPWPVERLLGFAVTTWGQYDARPTTARMFRAADSGLDYDAALKAFTAILLEFQMTTGGWSDQWIDFQAVMADGRMSAPSTPMLLETASWP